MNTLMRNRLLAFTFLTSLFSCGGGSSGGDHNVSGIDGSGAPISSTSGTINGFGSVIVNGIKYNSDKAKILVSGQLSTEDSLHAGYQVKIIGQQNSDGTGIADSIEFTPNIIGSISQIDIQKETMTLLNQTVQINNETVFDVSIGTMSNLKIGDAILISGQLESDGTLLATRIEKVPANNLQITGFIANLTDTTFTLNNLTVNYSAATLIDVENSRLENNMLVNITGVIGNTVFQAKTITRLKTNFNNNVKVAELSGFITRFASSSDFDVAGVSCTTDTQTQYMNGDASGLKQGANITIKGTINSSGKLSAQRLIFKQKINHEIAGEVENKLTDSTSIIATGNFKINGTLIKTTVTTLYEDKSNGKLKRFNFNDINAGDFLRVSGYTSQNVFMATKIERNEFHPENDTELEYEGAILSGELASSSFVVYGRNIQVNDQTEIRRDNGEKLTPLQFFTVIAKAPAQQVKVRGLLKNGVYLATRIELTSEDD